MYQRLGGYKISRRLGAGGMAEVYLAEDTYTGKYVALKILSKELAKDPTFIEHFRQEATVQSKLVHQNVLRVFSFDSDCGLYFMTMEFVEGHTLYELIRTIKCIEETRALSIFKQMLNGVDYLHSKGILHQDINPRNILLDADETVKITDFGIAKSVGELDFESTIKGGTLYYMSPEQLENIRPFDQRSDLYSLGITLYEMLTGRLPFSILINEESDSIIKKEILTAKIRDPREYNPSISHNTVSVLYKMIERQRDKRCVTCEEVLKLLFVPNAEIKNSSEISTSETNVKKFVPTLDRKIFGATLSASFLSEEEQTTFAHAAISTIVFSPDGEQFATGNMRGKIRFFDATSFKEIRSYTAHPDGINSICFSPDKIFFATASIDKTIKVWYFASGTVKAILRGHTAPVMATVFSSSGKYLYTGGFDNQIKVWEIESGKEIQSMQIQFKSTKNYLTSFSFARNAKFFAGGCSDATIKLWDLSNGKEIATLFGNTKPLYALAFSANSEFLASGSMDGTIRIWRVYNGEEVLSLKAHENKIYTLAFSSNNKYLASGSTDNTVKIWNVTNGMVVTSLKEHTNDVSSLSFSPDRQFLISGDWGNSILIWKLESE
jgi:serine/threonine protein kinase